jgi:hypothetical protein
MKSTDNELVAAARALDSELSKYEDGVSSYIKLALTSKKGLERASALLEELAEAEDRAGQQAQLLVKAVAATTARQTARLDEVRAKAIELSERKAAFNALVANFESLGKGASAINERLLAEPSAGGVDAELNALVARAEELVALAKSQHFDDVAHLADGLRQQVSAIRGKLLKASGPSA